MGNSPRRKASVCDSKLLIILLAEGEAWDLFGGAMCFLDYSKKTFVLYLAEEDD